MFVCIRNANFMYTAHAQFGYPYSMGIAHAADGRHYCLMPRGVPVGVQYTWCMGSVFNVNDSGSEQDTESEDRDQRRRRPATLCKQRQRSKNADNDRNV